MSVRRQRRFTYWLLLMGLLTQSTLSWTPTVGATAPNLTPPTLGQKSPYQTTVGTASLGQWQALQAKATQDLLDQPATHSYFEANFNIDGAYGELHTGAIVTDWEALAKAMGTTGIALAGAYALWRRQRKSYLAQLRSGDPALIEALFEEGFGDPSLDDSSSVDAASTVPSDATQWEAWATSKGLPGAGATLAILYALWLKRKDWEATQQQNQLDDFSGYRSVLQQYWDKFKATQPSTAGFTTTAQQDLVDHIKAQVQAQIDALAPVVPKLSARGAVYQRSQNLIAAGQLPDPNFTDTIAPLQQALDEAQATVDDLQSQHQALQPDYDAQQQQVHTQQALADDWLQQQQAFLAQFGANPVADPNYQSGTDFQALHQQQAGLLKPVYKIVQPLALRGHRAFAPQAKAVRQALNDLRNTQSQLLGALRNVSHNEATQTRRHTLLQQLSERLADFQYAVKALHQVADDHPRAQALGIDQLPTTLQPLLDFTHTLQTAAATHLSHTDPLGYQAALNQQLAQAQAALAAGQTQLAALTAQRDPLLAALASAQTALTDARTQLKNAHQTQKQALMAQRWSQNQRAIDEFNQHQQDLQQYTVDSAQHQVVADGLWQDAQPELDAAPGVVDDFADLADQQVLDAFFSELFDEQKHASSYKNFYKDVSKAIANLENGSPNTKIPHNWTQGILDWWSTNRQRVFDKRQWEQSLQNAVSATASTLQKQQKAQRDSFKQNLEFLLQNFSPTEINTIAQNKLPATNAQGLDLSIEQAKAKLQDQLEDLEIEYKRSYGKPQYIQDAAFNTYQTKSEELEQAFVSYQTAYQRQQIIQSLVSEDSAAVEEQKNRVQQIADLKTEYETQLAAIHASPGYKNITQGYMKISIDSIPKGIKKAAENSSWTDFWAIWTKDFTDSSGKPLSFGSNRTTLSIYNYYNYVSSQKSYEAPTLPLKKQLEALQTKEQKYQEDLTGRQEIRPALNRIRSFLQILQAQPDHPYVIDANKTLLQIQAWQTELSQLEHDKEFKALSWTEEIVIDRSIKALKDNLAAAFDKLAQYQQFFTADPDTQTTASDVGADAALLYHEGLYESNPVKQFLDAQAAAKDFYQKYDRDISVLKTLKTYLEQPTPHYLYHYVGLQVDYVKVLDGEMPDIWLPMWHHYPNSSRTHRRIATPYRNDHEIHQLRVTAAQTFNNENRRDLYAQADAREAQLAVIRGIDWDANHAQDVEDHFTPEEIAEYQTLQQNYHNAQQQLQALQAAEQAVVQVQQQNQQARVTHNTNYGYYQVSSVSPLSKEAEAEALQTFSRSDVQEISLNNTSTAIPAQYHKALWEAYRRFPDNYSDFSAEAARLLDQAKQIERNLRIAGAGIPAAPAMTKTVRDYKDDPSRTLADVDKEIAEVQAGIPLLHEKYAGQAYLQTALNQAQAKIDALERYKALGPVAAAQYDADLAAWEQKNASTLASIDASVNLLFNNLGTYLSGYWASAGQVVAAKKEEIEAQKIIDTRNSVELVDGYTPATSAETAQQIDLHFKDLAETWAQVQANPSFALTNPASLAQQVSFDTEQGKILRENGQTWDSITNSNIQKLHPVIRTQATNFINAVQDELGITLRISSGYRSFQEQEVLYSKGRTTGGAIVTNAQGGDSYHNYGLAIDVVEIKNGVANYNLDWQSIGNIGKRIGFEWGGDWTGFVDRPHFQISKGLSIETLKQRVQSGNLRKGFVNLGYLELNHPQPQQHSKVYASTSSSTISLHQVSQEEKNAMFFEALKEGLGAVFGGEVLGQTLQTYLINHGRVAEVENFKDRLLQKHPEASEIVNQLSVDDLMIAYPESKDIAVDLGWVILDVAGGSISKVFGKVLDVPLDIWKQSNLNLVKTNWQNKITEIQNTLDSAAQKIAQWWDNFLDTQAVAELKTKLAHESTLKHILEGNINLKGQATGFHHLPSAGNDARIIPGTKSIPNQFGVYEAQIEIRNSSGEWVKKVSNGGKSTFFPDNWSKDDIARAVNEAYEDRKPLARKDLYEGFSNNSIKVKMFIDESTQKITAVFPKF